MRTFRLAMAQINPTVGDLDGNTARILSCVDRARALRADMVAFPELAITGYPPEDLLLKPQFLDENMRKMRQVVEASRGISIVVGFVDAGNDVYNAAAVAHDGQLVDVYHKIYLPNYGVFDEVRYFKVGSGCPVYVVNGTAVGVNICEDIWYAAGPTVVQSDNGAELIVNINGSPFHAGKRAQREEMLATRAGDNGLYIAYVNLVGGQDELVFDGGSAVFGPTGEAVVRGTQFEEELIAVDLDVEAVRSSRLSGPRLRKERSSGPEALGPPRVLPVSGYTPRTLPGLPPHQPPTCYSAAEEVYRALVAGTKDYVRKCGFSKVVVALSGGIDSSLVATVAADALGPENVVGVSMPSRYSSEGSVEDAKDLAANLGIRLLSLPIEPPFTAFLDILASHFDGMAPNEAEENLQSRIRGNLVMALSNKMGWMVLTTGNKSEMAVGYATIYGDMAGGYAVIKDVPKTMVYELARRRNAAGDGPLIPQSVIDKPPSAELRPDQTDQDSLPPYDVLDAILKAYVEEDVSFNGIVALGFDEDVVKLVVNLVDRSEHKRRQSPPGIKITPRSFGRDRRMPIANRHRPF